MTGERDLRSLLEDAVADVDPVDRLDDIRARVAARPARGWAPVVGGAVVAVAATIAVVAVVTVSGDERPSGSPGPAGSPAPHSSAPPTHPAAVYYLGETDAGYRLFREFHAHEVAGRTPLPDLAAPADPDYSTFWPDAFSAARERDGVMEVELRDELPDAPEGMSPALAELSIQQVVYTVQAAAGRRLPVLFLYDGEPVDRLFGITLDGPVEHRPEAEVLAGVLVNDPVEGQTVSGSFTARGAGLVEGAVTWQLMHEDEIVDSGSTTVDGATSRHRPWEVTLDLSGHGPGTYTFIATNGDFSGGDGFVEDTRTVVVE